jgi:polyhydroxybutyrate depolymerase
MTTTSHTLESGGLERHYLVHAPAGHAPDKMPLVVLLHGAGGTADWTLEETDMATKADRAGFLLAVPDATRADPSRPAGFLENPQVWNDNGGHGLLGASAADDVGFIRAMLDHIENVFSVDRKRVYVTGFSNGACMTFCLGNELSERFAALAPVSGSLRLKDPHPAIARPTIYIVGSADPLMPLEGGTVRSPWDGRVFRRAPAVETFRRWAIALGCPPEPISQRVENGVHISRYGPGRDGACLVAYVIDGLGHHWPGGRGRLNRRFAGSPSDRVSANDLIWDFFRQHPQP